MRGAVKVLVAASRPEEAALQLGPAPAGARYVLAGDPARLETEAPDAEVFLLWDGSSTVLRQLWPALVSLRWVQTAWAGVDRLLFPELVESPVVLTNAAGVYDAPMAEYVLALLLAFVKDLPTLLDDQRARRWRHRLTETLEGKTLGIVGFGRIGRALARRARPFGLRIVGLRRTASGSDPDADLVLPADRLADLLQQSDVLVITAPMTAETRGLIGAAELAQLKAGAYLINVGRGGIVDEEALLAALHSGRLRGAALDVFAEEPLPPTSPLWTAPGCIVSPHMAGDDVRWRERVAALFRENLNRYLAEEPLIGLVNKRRGY